MGRKPTRKRSSVGENASASPPPDEAWRSLRKRFPHHAALGGETTYALPVRLIDLITKQMPGFLSSEDEKFERSLAEAAPQGFFRRRRIWYAPLALQVGAAQDPGDVDKRLQDSRSNARSTIEKQLRSHGASAATIREFSRIARREDESVTRWQNGYAGWLATSAEFHQDLGSVRQAFGDQGGRARLPRIEPTLTGHPRDSSDFIARWLPFCQKWGIEGLATWDLPIPMRPQITTPCFYPPEYLAASGVLLFVPWFLLRHRGFDLNEVGEQNQLLLTSPGLKEWTSPKEKNWGPLRYHTMLKLFVYFELALKRRYSDRLRGRVAAFDQVFIELLDPSADRGRGVRDTPDNVKKVRLRLASRLRQIGA